MGGTELLLQNSSRLSASLQSDVRAWEDFCRCLLRAEARIPLNVLTAWVRALPDPFPLVRDRLEFSDTAYHRTSLVRGPHAEALVLGWRPGQQTPVHHHAGSACVVRVLGGQAMETVYTRMPVGRLTPATVQRFATGALTSSMDTDLHRLGNDAQSTLDLVTLHVYSPPLMDPATCVVNEDGSIP